MNDWFTVEKIDDETFAVSEYRHWEETHCYVLCGETRAVVIDTGLGVANIREVIDGLTALPLFVVTTHVHWDHIGGHRYFDAIAVHEAEEAWLSRKFPIPLQTVKKSLMRAPCIFPDSFRIEEYTIFQGTPEKILYDGDCLDLGGRQLKVIHTPGHSPGHCCFYERERKYLYSGDLIYKGCLDAFYPTTDPALFFQSVQKIQPLAVNRLLPAHHTLSISPAIIDKVEKAFHRLSDEGKLQQGNGIFDFEDFQIHI